jgi:diacylglycerol kinase (CTP)
MRESEVRGWNGVVWYLVGTITVLAVFPKDVATLSILLLSWCDTAASTFGRLWGRYTPAIRKGKSLAGSLAAAVVGALSAVVWWGWIVPGTQSFPDDPVGGVMWAGRLAIGNAEITGGVALAAMSILTGIVASASEMLDAWGLDDNVVIPVVSAVGIWGILKVFG